MLMYIKIDIANKIKLNVKRDKPLIYERKKKERIKYTYRKRVRLIRISL